MYAAQVVFCLGNSPTKLVSRVGCVVHIMCKAFLVPLWETRANSMGATMGLLVHNSVTGLITFDSVVLGHRDSKLAFYHFSVHFRLQIQFPSRLIFSRV
jgi:hypothetical protein